MESDYKRDPIRFLYKHEIVERANYRAQLTVGASELSHIVGIFNFDEKDAFRCGLNGCNQKHWNGLIISTNGGLETHCGLVCGAREFPEDFEAKRALFSNALRLFESTKTVTDLKEKSIELVASLQKKQTTIERLYPQLKNLRAEFRKSQSSERALNNALRLKGAIEVPIKLTEIELEATGGRQKFKMKRIGFIEGIQAINDYAKIAAEVDRLIVSLQEIQSINPEHISSRTISQYVQLNNSVPSALEKIERYLDSAHLLAKASNKKEIEKLVAIESINDNRAEKILNSFDDFCLICDRINLRVN